MTDHKLTLRHGDTLAVDVEADAAPPPPPPPPDPDPVPDPEPPPTPPPSGANILGVDLAKLPKSGTAYTRVKALAAKSAVLDFADNTCPGMDVFQAKGIMGDTAGQDAMVASAKNRDTASGVPGGRARNLIAFALGLSLGSNRKHDALLRSLRDRKYTDFGLLAYPDLAERGNNHGVSAHCAQICVDAHLGDRAHLDATVLPSFKARLTGGSPKFTYGDLIYQPDKSNPVVICPPGSTVNGINADGALPEEQRRGGGFPSCSDYNYSTAGYFLVSAKALETMGVPVWSEGSQAVRRVFAALQRFGCKPAGDDVWLGQMAKALLGTAYLPLGGGDGKYANCTDYLFG